MTARSTARPQLPAGLTPVEEAQWWDEHRESGARSRLWGKLHKGPRSRPLAFLVE